MFADRLCEKKKSEGRRATRPRPLDFAWGKHGASVGSNIAGGGTRGQLVGGTVEVQLAENFLCSGNCGCRNQSGQIQNPHP